MQNIFKNQKNILLSLKKYIYFSIYSTPKYFYVYCIYQERLDSMTISSFLLAARSLNWKFAHCMTMEPAIISVTTAITELHYGTTTSPLLHNSRILFSTKRFINTRIKVSVLRGRPEMAPRDNDVLVWFIVTKPNVTFRRFCVCVGNNVGCSTTSLPHIWYAIPCIVSTH